MHAPRHQCQSFPELGFMRILATESINSQNPNKNISMECTSSRFQKDDVSLICILQHTSCSKIAQKFVSLQRNHPSDQTRVLSENDSQMQRLFLIFFSSQNHSCRFSSMLITFFVSN